MIYDALLWTDLETTGVEPDARVIEIAMVPTTFDADFRPLSEPFHAVIHYGSDLRVADVDPFVLAMHAKNGLWEEASDASLTPAKMGNELRVAIANWDLKGEISLAGRSVHNDRRWLENFLSPSLFAELRLGHRHFDLTPVKKFAEMAGIEVDVEQTDEHRAIYDVLADIELARKLVKAARTPRLGDAGASQTRYT